MLSLAAIGILLAYYNNKPVLDWKGVTLNVIVSVLSTLSNALLSFTLSECLGQAKWIWLSWKQRPLNDLNLIDQGSRGPLGSMKLLAQPAARSFISIGALAVILSAASDPFVQLTLGRREDVQFANNPIVQIAHAKRYSKGSFSTRDNSKIVSSDGNTYYATEADADFEMKSAVFYGLSQPGYVISQQAQRNCPSGNCTWEPFVSLSVCSACNDLTDQIKKKYLGFTAPLVVDLAELASDSVEEDVTKYYLPNGLHGDRSVQMTAYGTGNTSESLSFSNFDTLIWSMTMMNFTLFQEPDDNNRTSVNVSAIECGLWYCVNSYNSTVKEGNLTEKITPAPSKRDPSSWQPISDTWAGNATPPNALTYGINSSSVLRMDLRLGDGFSLSQAAVYSISELMESTFTAPDWAPSYAPLENSDINTSPVRIVAGINAYVLGSNDNIPYVPTAMQSLVNSQDLARTFAVLAQSMTNNIRQNDDNNTVSTGQLGTNVVLNQVRGWFLALPVTLVTAGAIFLAIVLKYTNEYQLAVWGTNELPLVALGEKIGHIFDDNDMSSRQMKKDAKRQLVQLPAWRQRPGLSRLGTNRGRGNYEMLPPLKFAAKQTSSTNSVSFVSDDVEERQQNDVRNIEPPSL